jgi:hypothetical protein
MNPAKHATYQRLLALKERFWRADQVHTHIHHPLSVVRTYLTQSFMEQVAVTQHPPG